eukprot:tig00001384_g8551.t1
MMRKRKLGEVEGAPIDIVEREHAYGHDQAADRELDRAQRQDVDSTSTNPDATAASDEDAYESDDRGRVRGPCPDDEEDPPRTCWLAKCSSDKGCGELLCADEEHEYADTDWRPPHCCCSSARLFCEDHRGELTSCDICNDRTSAEISLGAYDDFHDTGFCPDHAPRRCRRILKRNMNYRTWGDPRAENEKEAPPAEPGEDLTHGKEPGEICNRLCCEGTYYCYAHHVCGEDARDYC